MCATGGNIIWILHLQHVAGFGKPLVDGQCAFLAQIQECFCGICGELGGSWSPRRTEVAEGVQFPRERTISMTGLDYLECLGRQPSIRRKLHIDASRAVSLGTACLSKLDLSYDEVVES